jgi:hypothetical protein
VRQEYGEGSSEVEDLYEARRNLNALLDDLCERVEVADQLRGETP